MLHHLEIQNYAIIESISVDFGEGLLVITGETGAGKSIIAGALSLVLGERADTGVLRKGDHKAVVEAGFRVSHLPAVEEFLREEGLDIEAILVLRREISAQGKSRAFINDTPVNLDQLRRLCSLLVDLHQQFDTVSLGESQFQLNVVDALARHPDLLASYQEIFSQWQDLRRRLDILKEKQATAEKENDYRRFLYQELEDAALHENEFEEAEIALKRQSHAEAIKKALSEIGFHLQSSEKPLVQQLKSSIHQLEPFRPYHDKFPEIIQRLSSAQIELQDLAEEIENLSEDLQYDPREIEKLSERIHTGYKLFKKHQVSDTASLIRIYHELGSRLSESVDIAEEIQQLEKQTGSTLNRLSEKAALISSGRKAQIAGLEKKVNQLLKKVGMPNARLRVVSHTVPLNANGTDAIEFLFDANHSDRFEPLKKVASGGELSRLMLCIKSLAADSIDMLTLLFDEIDSGISGEAARQVGILLKELSEKRQVICITHQPQIAARGDEHFFVYKEIKGDQMQSGIRRLEGESRILAIAKMLSGEKPSAAALENARELVS